MRTLTEAWNRLCRATSGLNEAFTLAPCFNPKQKEKRWVAFFSSGSRYGEELREEIVRMKELFEQSSADAGRDGTEKHGVFDAEPEAFGVLAKEGGGEIHKLQKAMFDTIKTLRMENVTRRARALHPDDARR